MMFNSSHLVVDAFRDRYETHFKRNYVVVLAKNADEKFIKAYYNSAHCETAVKNGVSFACDSHCKHFLFIQ